MLKRHNDGECPTREGKNKKGKMRKVGAKDAFKILPNQVMTNNLLRKDIYEVLGFLNSEQNPKDIVLIFGIPGLGKSLLLKNVCWYVGERDFFRDGVIFLDLQSCQSFSECIGEMVCALKSLFKDPKFKPEDDEDPEAWVSKILQKQQMFKGKTLRHNTDNSDETKAKLLLALDNVDMQNDSEYHRLMKFINQIASDTLKVLYSSSNPDV